MSAFILKIIAAVTMLVDHTGLILFPSNEMLRVIGRLAFPIYAYFIAEGFRYTRSRHKYFLKIFLLGLLCQIVYYIADRSLYMCVLITFSLSIVIMAFVDKLKKSIRGEDNFFRKFLGVFFKEKVPRGLEIAFAAVGTAAVIALVYLFCSVVEVDYDFSGVMLPVLVSLFEGKYPRLAMFSLGVLFVWLFPYCGFTTQVYSLVTIPLIAAYNGKPGKVRMKYFFYIFYPAHLAILYLISILV